MASERQIAATAATRVRAPVPVPARVGNGRAATPIAIGLTLSITSTAAYAKQLDKLARKIAGNTDDATTLEYALQIAQAELELARAGQGCPDRARVCIRRARSAAAHPRRIHAAP